MPSIDFTKQFGGLFTAVIPYDRANPALGVALRDAISHEAKVHGAAFNPQGFNNVIQELGSGVEALFLLAAWDVTKPKVVGVMLNFSSLFLEKSDEGIRVGKGNHTEDFALLMPKVRELVAEKPKGALFPVDSLATILEREALLYMARNGNLGRSGEIALHNTKIARVVTPEGAVFGTERDSGILTLDRITDKMFSKWRVPVETLGISLADDSIDPKNFLTLWRDSNGRGEVMLSHSLHRSTTTGKNRKHVVAISDSNPQPEILESAVSSLMIAGEQEAAQRRWGTENSAFGAELPAHIYLLKEPELLKAFKKTGAETRVFGELPTKPGFVNLVSKWKELNLEPVRPALITGCEAANNPCFDLGKVA